MSMFRKLLMLSRGQLQDTPIFCEYITGKRNSGIDTGYILTNQSEIRMRYDATDATVTDSINYLFCAGNTWWDRQSTGNTKYYYRFLHSGSSNMPYTDMFVDIEMKSGHLTLNGADNTLTTSLSQETSTLIIGNKNTYDQGFIGVRYHYVDIYENGVLVMALRPAVGSISGNVGLYDTLNNRWHYSQGSNSFIAPTGYAYLGFAQGYINTDGTASTSSDADHGNYITSDFIVCGFPFSLNLNDGYKVTMAFLYKADGTFFGKFYEFASGLSSNGYLGGQTVAWELPQGYKLRVVAAKSDSTAISPSDNVVEIFHYLNTWSFKRDSDNFTEPWKINAYNRCKQLCNILTKPVIDSNHWTDRSDEANFEKDRIYNGVNYSEVGDQCRFVGIEVGFKTYQSALRNPRSVMFTEIPYNNTTSSRTTEYGYNYISTENDTRYFYGIVCACLADYTYATKGHYTAAWYGDNFMNGEVVTGNFQALDCMVYPTHVMVLLDVLRDSSNNVIYYAVAQSTIFMTRITYLTPSQFETFRASYTVYRFSNLDTPEPDFEIDNSIIDKDYDICPNLGDYSTYKQNETVVLNVKGAWDGIKVYKEISDGVYSDTPIITSTTGTAHNIAQLNETWYDYDISSNFTASFAALATEHGKYKAVAYSGATESEPCYFEVLLFQNRSIYVNGVGTTVANQIHTNGSVEFLINGTSLNGYPLRTSSSNKAPCQPHIPVVKIGNNLSNIKQSIQMDLLNTVSTYSRICVKGTYGYASNRLTNLTGTNSRTNKATWTPGSFLRGDGTVGTIAEAALSNYIAIGSGLIFVFRDNVLGTSNYTHKVAYYDSNQNLIPIGYDDDNSPIYTRVFKSNTTTNSGDNICVLIDSIQDAAYIRICTLKDYTLKYVMGW